jgi:hypothetical protein
VIEAVLIAAVLTLALVLSVVVSVGALALSWGLL